MCCQLYHGHFEISVIPHCRHTGLACAKFYLDNLGNDQDGIDMDEATDINNESKKCYQRCEFQSELITVTTTTYPNYNTFEDRNDLCLIIKKLDIICKDKPKYAVFYHFYEKDPTFPKSTDFCTLISQQIANKVCVKNFQILNQEKNVDQELYKFIITYTKQNIVKMKIFFRDPYYTRIEKDVSMTFTSFLGTAGGLLGLCTGMSIVSLFELVYFLVKLLSNVRIKKE